MGKAGELEGRIGASWRECGGKEVCIDFCGHDSSPKIFGLALSKGWLQIEIKKSVKENERQEGHEQEAFDGGGVVLQEMIGVPTLDQFIEAVIFDVPSLMAKANGTLDGDLRRR